MEDSIDKISYQLNRLFLLLEFVFVKFWFFYIFKLF